MNENPLVTVNILSFNRKEELRNTLTKVYEQDYKNIEIIVVDNASSDGSAEMVKSEFPEVQLIKLEKNIGIAGWNEGFKVAKGEYVLVLDDDAYPKPSAIWNALVEIQKDNNNAVVALKIFDQKKNKIITENLSSGIALTFIGCGALFLKKALKVTGYFCEKLFLYEHEIEISMNFYERGYKLIYSPSSIIIHSNSLLNRPVSENIDYRRVYYTTRNIIFILLTKFSINKIIFRVLRISIGRLFLSLNNHCTSYVIRGIVDGVFLSIKNIPNRGVLSKGVQEIYNYGSYAGGFYGQDSMLI